MISVIISSIKKDLLEQCCKSIEETIGTEYELIVFDNTVENKGLCQIYNDCAKLAKYPFLCFCHEDIIFHSSQWGAILCDFVAQEKVGAVGVAGARVVSDFPYVWWNFYDANRINVIQHDANNRIRNWQSVNRPKYEEVLVLDGTFLLLRKEVWNEILFDPINFSRFHYYDIDFTYHVSFKYKNYVCNDILIEHFSIGNINSDWFEASLCFVEKWKNTLPAFIDAESTLKVADQEKQNLFWYIRSLVLQSNFSIYRIKKIAIFLNNKLKNNSIMEVKIYCWILLFIIQKYLLKMYHILTDKKIK